MPRNFSERTDSQNGWPQIWEGDCPLCGGKDHELYFRDRLRPYYRCGRCDLIFVPDFRHLDPEAEKARYDHHENNPGDRGYRDYLGRIIPPLKTALNRDFYELDGLDFGCGPSPVLAGMLEEEGARMALYDPYYHRDREPLERSYDFITCTEVFEHMARPGREIDRLLSLLKEGGLLAVMTLLVTDQTDFSSWYYRTDTTHISFFSRESFMWLCRSRGVQADFYGRDIIILKGKTDK